jgi:hypothetical protein
MKRNRKHPRTYMENNPQIIRIWNWLATCFSTEESKQTQESQTDSSISQIGKNNIYRNKSNHNVDSGS